MLVQETSMKDYIATGVIRRLIFLCLIVAVAALGAVSNKDAAAQIVQATPISAELPQRPALSTGIPTITNTPTTNTPTTNTPTTNTLTPRVSTSLAPATSGQVSPLTIVGQESARSEFQKFLTAVSGIDLQMFGTSLFSGVPSTFAPVDSLPITPDYVLGPGDEIVIRAWGAVDIDYRATIDRLGTISIPRIGVVNLSGIRYQDLNDFLKTTIGRVFRNFELTANLGQLRSIQIYVVGQAQKPGVYTVSSLSTLLNAIFAVGGPNISGSLRSIQLKRGDRVITELDLYDLLIRGDKSKDARLLPGDVIFIPPVGGLSAVTGSVNSPAIYELKRGETLADALRFASGLSTTAEGQKATVERIENRQIRKVDEFSLDAAGLARLMRDGDVVTVYSIVPRFDNAVTLRGNVAQPLRLVWRSGLRVKDVIPERAALLSRDYWLSRSRVVAASPLLDLGRATTSTGGGSGIERQNQALLGGMNAERQNLNTVRPPVGEVNWEYAVIERLNKTNYTTSLVPFHLGKAVIDGDPQQNLVLEPGDVITIFSKEDVKVPVASQTKYIRLEGEFVHSGVYQVMPGETLRQIIQRAGGLTVSAYLYGSEFNRESTRKLQQEKLDEATSRLDRDLQRVAASRSQNSVTPEDAQNLKPQLEAQQALIAKLRAVKATGRIVMEIPPDAQQVKDIPDIALEDGDRFVVPSPPSTVGVFGSVYNENSFMFKAEKRLDDYLSQAGGPTRDADESSLYVLRADGSVVSRRQGSVFAGLGSGIGGLRPMPGDTIVVPEQLDKTEFRRILRDWTQIFSQFGLGVAALKVFKSL